MKTKPPSRLYALAPCDIHPDCHYLTPSSIYEVIKIEQLKNTTVIDIVDDENEVITININDDSHTEGSWKILNEKTAVLCSKHT